MAKELMHVVANYLLTVHGKVGRPEFKSVVEVGVVVSEPNYRADAGGEMVRFRDTETVRFHAAPVALREMSRTFGEWADEADRLAAAANKRAAKAADPDTPPEPAKE